MKNRKKAALLFVSPMTKTERQVIEVSHAAAWGKNKEHKIIYQDISSICFTYISTEKKKAWAEGSEYPCVPHQRDKERLQWASAACAFQIIRCFFFFLLFFLDDCIGHFFQFCYNVHLSGATLHLQQCCRHEWKTNSIELFQATFMSVLNCLFLDWNIIEYWVFPLELVFREMLWANCGFIPRHNCGIG